MTEAKHLKRKYSGHIERVHVLKEPVTVEIHRLVKETEQMYLYGQVSYTNAELYHWKAWNSLICVDTRTFYVEFDYYAPDDGKYRIETLYSTSQANDYFLKANIFVDGVKQTLNQQFGAFPTDIKRNTLQMKLKKGNHHIKLLLDDPIIWLGSICRRVYTYHGKDDNEGLLTLKKANFKTTGATTIDELSFVLQYEDWMEDKNYGNPDLKFNQSGYIFDYRDEVNLYASTDLYLYKDKANSDKFTTLRGVGPHHRIFGGYISTVSVDDKMTEMTVNCAGRLKDAELKHTLSEITIAGGTEKYTEYSENEMLRFSTYTTALQYLCRNLENTLNNNIPTDYNYLDSERNPKYVRWDYNKDSPILKNGLKDLIWHNLGSVEQKDNGIYLRNAPNTGFQSITLYDSDLGQNVTPIDITDMPNFYITYEMLEPKWEETINGTSSSISGNGTTEDAIWNEARQIIYGHSGYGSTHDPMAAKDNIYAGRTADCYGLTAWLYYKFNFQAGIPARDIKFRGTGTSGSHHTIQLYKNGQWINPKYGYTGCSGNFGFSASMYSEGACIYRAEPDSNGNIPPLTDCNFRTNNSAGGCPVIK